MKLKEAYFECYRLVAREIGHRAISNGIQKLSDKAIVEKCIELISNAEDNGNRKYRTADLQAVVAAAMNEGMKAGYQRFLALENSKKLRFIDGEGRERPAGIKTEISNGIETLVL